MWPFTKKTETPKNVFNIEFSVHQAPVDLGFKLKAYLDERIIGESHGEFEKGKDFRLVKIDVIPKNLGYGTKIIDRLIFEARANNCVRFIFVGVDIANDDAIRLYARYGATAQLPLKSKNDYVFLL